MTDIGGGGAEMSAKGKRIVELIQKRIDRRQQSKIRLDMNAASQEGD